MEFTELQKRYKPQILALAEKYGTDNVRVFGSTVRDDATPDSDIDLLIHVRKGTSLLDLSALYIELGILTGCKIDLIPDDSVAPDIRDHIFREARPL